jgi:hypothetical protein
LTPVLVAALLALGACGSGDEPAADTGADDPPSESTSETASPSPDVTPTTAAGTGASFEVKGMCKAIDRGLVRRIAGPTLGRDVFLETGELAPTGAQVQGPTCSIEGGQGRIEASVIMIPELADRRRNMPKPSGNGVTCVDVPSDSWDKSWDCKDQLGSGPILIRSGENGVLSCWTNAKGPARTANAHGRALCDDLLEKVSS